MAALPVRFGSAFPSISALLLTTALALPATALAAPGAVSAAPLVVRLGYPRTAKLLIINGDDFGMSHATNVATIRALGEGGLSSASVLVPCPWFPEVAAFARKNPKFSLGVHLALNSEWENYRWGPVAGAGAVPSLVDELGYLARDIDVLQTRSTRSDVERELRAQIDRAKKAGIDVTHLDAHMGALMVTKPEFLQTMFELAAEQGLPVRIDRDDMSKRTTHAAPLAWAASHGLLSPEAHVYLWSATLEETPRYWKLALDKVRPGFVTEIIVHANQATDEASATATDWLRRAADAEFLASADLRDALRARGITLVSYRALRDLQRRETNYQRVRP